MATRRPRGWQLSLALGLAVSGCARDRVATELAEIYDHTGRNDRMIARHDPIVAVPGFLGSSLEDPASGELLWGSFLGHSQRPRDADYIRALGLPVDDAPLGELRDEIRVTGVMRTGEVDLGRRTATFNAYAGIITGILMGWQEGEDPRRNDLRRASRALGNEPVPLLEQVGYDWRRDIAESAVELHRHLLEAQAVARQHRRSAGLSEEDLRLDVVGHSTGCLVLRYYLRYGTQPLPEDGTLPELNWAGTTMIRRAILLAPPNRGSLSSFNSLAYGGKPFPILPHFPAPLLGTFVALYELMPPPSQAMVVYEDGTPVDLYDVGTWEHHDWGLFRAEEAEALEALLPGLDEAQRRARARAYMGRALARARQFHEALAVPAAPPPGTTVHLFASDTEPTERQLVIERATGKVLERIEGPGDGTVPRDSALADLRPFDSDLRPLVSPVTWATVHWVGGTHLGMFGDRMLIDNLLYMLFEDPGFSTPAAQAPAGEPEPRAEESDAPDAEP